uniref:Uncharacterized protein n=1 Tax=Aegilops tauschii subsp. strangulata TaxID=200361 RepID=A0A452Z8T6_AEGTS
PQLLPPRLQERTSRWAGATVTSRPSLLSTNPHLLLIISPLAHRPGQAATAARPPWSPGAPTPSRTGRR